MMRLEPDAVLVVRGQGGEPGQIQWCVIGRMKRTANRPFEPGDVGEIGQRDRRWKAAQEVRELTTVLVQIGFARKVLPNECGCGAGKEVIADEVRHGR